jgi:hypothetical protein
MTHRARSSAAWLIPLMLCLGAVPLRPPPGISANDNRRPAGSLHADTLTLNLELGVGRWYPDADDGPSVEVQALGEVGRPLEIPSPLIRVPEGTVLRITLRNTLADSTLVIHGLRPARHRR